MYRPLEDCEWTLGCSVSNLDGGSDIGPDTRDRPLGVLPVAVSRPTLVLGTPHAQVGSELPRGALDATVRLRRGAAGGIRRQARRRVGSIARERSLTSSPVLKTTLAKASPKSCACGVPSEPAVTLGPHPSPSLHPALSTRCPPWSSCLARIVQSFAPSPPHTSTAVHPHSQSLFCPAARSLRFPLFNAVR